MSSTTSGFIIKASCEGHANLHSMGLRDGYESMVMDLADAFDLIPASVSLFSLHNGTKLMVHLGSQGDLEVVLAEAMEWGSHVVTVSVSGVPARRTLDGLGCLAVFAATISQCYYLYWMVTVSGATFYQELEIWTVLIIALIANFAGYAYLLDDESDKNHPFRLWIKPFGRRLLMLIVAPFSGDVLPLVGCKACGLDAPVRAATRDGVVKWGILLLVFQDVALLQLMYWMHFAPTADSELHPLDGIPTVALALTAFSVLLNLPRRLSHFVLASCEAAYREKEELAEDATISMFAAQKAGPKAADPQKGSPAALKRVTPPGSKPGMPAGSSRAANGPPSKRPQGTSPPPSQRPGSAPKKMVPPPKGQKAML